MLQIGVNVVTTLRENNIVDHLRYYKIKQNYKCSNFINQTLYILSSHKEQNVASSVGNLYRYLADNFGIEFISATGDIGLIFF